MYAYGVHNTWSYLWYCLSTEHMLLYPYDLCQLCVIVIMRITGSARYVCSLHTFEVPEN
jgi:hypothetical protein